MFTAQLVKNTKVGEFGNGKIYGLPVPYTLEFEIYPKGTQTGWSNILHIGNADNQRSPGLWFWPGKTSILIAIDTDAAMFVLKN